jgi:exonuclease SbcC
MRPHRLEVTAFGAFAGPVEVSFDALADAGLFLLHGETGAGKTTLLDAIGFALYGRVPGERGKTRRLRSDHASPDVRTEVVFETTIGPRHLRITRNPQQTRPKRHGNGVTTEPARILLEEETGGHWHAVSTRANEADREIADAMGMSAEQFYQVVLLPQGQFARFLHADAEERRALLQKLFRTDRFRSVEDWLADLRKTTRDRIKDAEQDLSVLTARIEQVAAVPPPPNPLATPDAPAPADSTATTAAPHVTPSSHTTPAPRAPATPATHATPAPRATPTTHATPATHVTSGPPAPVGPRTPADSADASESSAPADPPVATERPATWAADLAAAAAAEAGLAAEAVRAAQSALDSARAEADRVREQAGRQRRRAALIARRDELRAAGPQRSALRHELAAAGRAAAVAQYFINEGRSRAALATCRDVEDRARLSAAPAGLAATARPADYQVAEAERRQHTGQLQALRDVAQQATAEDTLADQADRRAAARGRDLDQAGRILAGQRAELDQRSGQHAAAQQAATRLPVTRAEAERLRAAAADAAQLADDCAGVRDLREQKASARDYAADQRERAQQLREERFDGMIGELAGRLTDDTPCPVCGSLDHPDPSELQGRRVTHHEVEQAYAEAEAAKDEVAKLDSELAIVVTRMGEMTARLITADVGEPVLREDAALVEAMTASPDDDAGSPAQPTLFDPVPGRISVMPAVGTVDRLCGLAADLTVAASAREDAATELAARAGQLGRLEEELTALRAAVSQTEQDLATLTEQRESARAEAEAARARAAAHRASLTSQLHGAPDLDTAIEAATALADALAAAARATEATVLAAAAADQAAAEAEQAATDAGFPDTAAAQAAFREPAWCAEQTRTLHEQEADVANVDAQLADPDLDVLLEPPADVAAAQQLVAGAAADHDAAVRRHEGASARADGLARLAPEFAQQVAALQPLRDRATEARQLADLAAGLGANALRMTLSAFVLAARLEEVAEAASHRLEKMTAGRYRLAHTDSRRGAGKSGLGLVAQDAWTGHDRDTSTLSGGETFLASLALALGLADVVTAEAAGVTIEALFVDEGFGTLDEETLEEVMTVLDTLREGGRMVGIVSHVAELRQRIPAQLHVRKTRAGSTVHLIAP